MPNKIGPTFSAELEKSGLHGLAFSWNPDTGEFSYNPEVTDAQRKRIEAVYARHNPDAVNVDEELATRRAIASVALAPLLTSLQLGDASEEEKSKARAWRDYSRALDAIAADPEDNPKWPKQPE